MEMNSQAHSSVASREFSSENLLFLFVLSLQLLIFHSNEYVITAAFYNCSPLFSAAELSCNFPRSTKNMRSAQRWCTQHTIFCVWKLLFFSPFSPFSWLKQCNRKFFIRQIHFFNNDRFPWQHVSRLPSEILLTFSSCSLFWKKKRDRERNDKRRTGGGKISRHLYLDILCGFPFLCCRLFAEVQLS